MELGILYVVATPIGNLGDLSERAKEILKGVDVILCEDTRETNKLLIKLGLKKRLLSYFDKNEGKRSREVLEYLREGKKVALVSDAGTPVIQDPGFKLVRLARENKIPVIPIPGPSAIVTALSVSGLPTNRFVFEGFLPKKESQAKKKLRELLLEERTIVLFESVHRIKRVLGWIKDVFGDIEIFVAREMTKLHESYYFGRVSEIINEVVEKGEFVIVIPGRGFRERN